mmetsp:Transcript_30949/g.66924  ORF Transcript_30949/g.66924 Transcript_30949/m.66924 type:complete len:84 (-) Transcript_30949:47-298(-)
MPRCHHAQKPAGGKVDIGETVRIGFVSQSRDALKETDTIYQAISEGLESFNVGGEAVNMRAYVAQFNFRGSDQVGMTVNVRVT